MVSQNRDEKTEAPLLADSSGEHGDIELVIIRHGQTPGNAERRYVGCASDQPLSEAGREQALQAQSFPQVSKVYVSKLRRTHETAALMFPHAEQVVVEGIHEMDFGVFTGRSADEMEEDEQYREWVEGWCEGVCPGGESKAQFNERICAAMKAFLLDAASRGEHALYMVAHGGTLMAFLGAYGGVEGKYYEWNVGNCRGYRLGIQIEGDDVRISSIELL